MALGGGEWQTPNKKLPGTYIKFDSAMRSTVALSDRGIVAVPMVLDWGVDGDVFSVTPDEFEVDSLAVFGYSFNADELRPMRELFKNATKLLVYKLNNDGVKATSDLATAKHAGTRGNSLKYVVSQNLDDTSKFDVSLYMGESLVFEQKAVSNPIDLEENDFVVWNKAATLTATVGVSLTGGTNGSEVTGNQYQKALDLFETQKFHILCCPTQDKTIQDLFVAYTRRLNTKQGRYFQTVVYRNEADYDHVISVENKIKFLKDGEVSIVTVETDLPDVEVGDFVKVDSGKYVEAQSGDAGALTVVADASHSLVYWVAGAEAGCAVNKSVLNKTYDGEYTVDVDYSQSELEDAIDAGKFMFHRVENEIKVLMDINTFVSFTVEKNKDYSQNQNIRINDQIGNDVTSIFNGRYIGKIGNDQNGRIALWSDIVTLLRQLETIRAIQNLDPDADLVVKAGSDLDAVIATLAYQPVNAMAKLYMTVTLGK